MLRRALWLLLGLVAAWVVLSLVFFTWSPWESGPPAHADAVIVLSGGRNRLPPALDLVRHGVAPVLAISSVSRTKPWRLGRQVCAAGKVGRATVLCFDAQPYSTQGEAEAVERLARRRGWKQIVVVTSRYHITRAHMLFRRCYDGGLSMVGVPTTWWKLPLFWASETGKLLVQLTVRRGC